MTQTNLASPSLTVWACSDCGAANAAKGNCSRCGEGPLLDARQPRVRDELWKTDERTMRRRNSRILPFIILLVTGGTLGTLWQVAPEFLLGLVFSPIPALMLVAMLAFTSFMLWKAMCALFPAKRRFGWLVEVAQQIPG